MGDPRTQDRVGRVKAGTVGRQRRRSPAFAEAVGSDIYIGEVSQRLDNCSPKMEVIADFAIDLGRPGVIAAGELSPKSGKGDGPVGRDIVPAIGRAQARVENVGCCRRLSIRV
jgi:hypothetical protein